MPLVSILGSNLPLVLSVRINGDLALEVWSLRSSILETSDEPLIGNVVLLALPTLSEEGRPDHDEHGVQDRQGRRQEVIPLGTFVDSLNYHSYTEDQAYDSHGDEPARVMDEPGKVEAKLLAIVVLNEIDWLHFPQESRSHHAPGQFPFVLIPRLANEVSLRHMHREVVEYDTTFAQVLHIKLR